jgi:serine/threonine protein kinase
LPASAPAVWARSSARDTKLNRNVALKILPETFTHDPDRVARFKREAQVLASLNHPHIAQIHGLEEQDGCSAIVMELVDGETLDARLKPRAPAETDGTRRFSGALPLDDALPIVVLNWPEELKARATAR